MKRNRILDIILAILILAIIVVAGAFAYDQYTKYAQTKGAQKSGTEIDNILENLPEEEEVEIASSSGASSGRKVLRQATYRGYEIIGRIIIDKTRVNYSILSVSNAYTLNRSITRLYGPYPNEVGNMVLAGHNFNNGSHFSKNKNLINGDIIKIVDLAGHTVQYSIYHKFETSGTDTSYLSQDTNGKREVTLVTCTDNGKLRIVIKAREI